MVANDTQSKVGIVLLVLGGILLFGVVAFGLPFVYEASAVSVLGLAVGAVLIGTAEDGRPV
ncbi:hypothetical protein [Halorussus aquaticus]|uniref:Uncharacterized protein n=1 Tax=Halorussus aquaticus TaxID=2953748 RepID=A0ABD5PXQ1_9EURY|nr:hypothetical protein [Halorussus aquaticus]